MKIYEIKIEEKSNEYDKKFKFELQTEISDEQMGRIVKAIIEIVNERDAAKTQEDIPF